MNRSLLRGKSSPEKIATIAKTIMLSLYSKYPSRTTIAKLGLMMGYSPASFYNEGAWPYKAVSKLIKDGLVVSYTKEDVGYGNTGFELTAAGFERAKQLDDNRTALTPAKTPCPVVGTGPMSDLFPDLIHSLKNRFAFIGSVLEEFGWINSINKRGELTEVKLHINAGEKRQQFHPNFIDKVSAMAHLIYSHPVHFELEREKVDLVENITEAGEEPSSPVPTGIAAAGSSLLSKLISVLEETLGADSLAELEGMRLDNKQFVITIARAAPEQLR